LRRCLARNRAGVTGDLSHRLLLPLAGDAKMHNRKPTYILFIFAQGRSHAAAWMPLPRNPASMVGAGEKAQSLQDIVMDARNPRFSASMTASMGLV